jgi:8-oxo-dGTP diphosphatase
MHDAVAAPATPDPHLVSCFLPVDGAHVLLVDHISAERWLPSGGHVEPDEDPRRRVVRKLRRELDLEAAFLQDRPVFVTVTETVARTAGHTDVSLWFVLRGDRTLHLRFDPSGLHGVRRFHHSDVPLDRTDPHLGRFLTRLYA